MTAEAGTNSTPPGADAETPLDPEGLPFTACPACGGGDFWKAADLAPEGPGWACAACTPPPAETWRHACAVPVQAAQRGGDKAGQMGYHDTVMGARR